MKNFPILMLSVAFCLFTQEADAQDKKTPNPKILDEKTWTWEGSTYNYAKCKDLTFEVSMGNKPDGVGCADAGVEIENVRNVKLSVDAPPSFNRYDENSFAGFMVDYHTSAGYTKRVGLSIGMYSEKRWAKTPIWGKVTVPSQFVDLGKKKEYDLDLQKWAPDGWDGRVWFVVSLQNTGRNTTLKAKAELLGEEERTKVVQKSKEEPAKPKDDKALLQGRWYAVAEEAVGKTLSKDELLTMNKILDVKGDEFHMERTDGGKRGSYVGTIRLGQADGQKLFDFEGKRPSGAQVELHGIYELTQDVFKVCYAVVPAGSKYTRPREFRTFAGTPTVFVTFKRSAGKVEIAQKPKEELGKKEGKETVEDKGASPSKDFTNSFGMKFVWIPPGTFLMGTPKEEFDLPYHGANETQHKVTLTKGFYMGAYTVTQEEWQAVMGNNPSWFKGEKNLPVEKVSWEGCQEFIKTLRKRDKKPYRLPTEAEWEYACRAGTTTPYYFGKTISTNQVNYKPLFRNGEQLGVWREKTTPVGSFAPNTWGLHDMHGNVYQWCQDWWGVYPTNDTVDPLGPEAGFDRVLRGGSWGVAPGSCRSAFRRMNVPGFNSSYTGFRVVFFLEKDEVARQEMEKKKEELARAELAKKEAEIAKKEAERVERQKKLFARIDERQKALASGHEKLDPAISSILKTTGFKYNENGFKKYVFGNSMDDVKAHTSFDADQGLKTFAAGPDPVDPRSYRGESWLVNRKSKEYYYFLNDKLLGFGKVYQNDIPGYTASMKELFGTTVKENVMPYAIVDKKIERDRFVSDRSDVVSVYYVFPKTVVGFSAVARSNKREAFGQKEDTNSQYVHLCLFERKFFEASLDLEVKEKRKMIEAAKKITAKIDEGNLDTDIPKLREFLAKKLEECPWLQVMSIPSPDEQNRVIRLVLNFQGLPDSVVRNTIFDDLCYRCDSVIAQKSFPPSTGTISFFNTRAMFNWQDYIQKVYSWEDRAGWSVTITTQGVDISRNPRKKLD